MVIDSRNRRLGGWLGRGPALLLAAVLLLGGGCGSTPPESPPAATLAFIGNFRGFQKPCG